MRLRLPLRSLPRPPLCRAWTLTEMLITLGIGSLVMMAVMQTALFTARSFVAMGNYADLDRASRHALDTMSREIREAKAVRYLGSSLIFTNMDNSWFYYLWDQNNRIVSRISGQLGVPGARTERLLVGCDQFSMRVFLRNPTNQFWFPYSASGQEQNTKLVDLRWRCSRRVLNQFNTESVQTAKIVLRN